MKHIMESGRFNSDLTLRFGLIAEFCEDEKQYLATAKKLIRKIKGLKKYELDDMFFGSPPAKKNLTATLDKILANILLLERN